MNRLTFISKPFAGKLAGVTLLLAAKAYGVNPEWWLQGTPPVIDGSAAPENKAVANIGQAKWMAYRALATIHAQIPAVALQIEADLVGPGKPITSWDAPSTPEESALQRAPLLVGQLKAIAAPFYTHIHAAAGTWLAAERTANGTETGDGYFPWTNTNASDDNNKGMASIGQLKAVFALHLTEDGDSDGVADFREWVMNGGLGGDYPLDLDEDGQLDSEELAAGSDPNQKDHPLINLIVTELN